jgi:cytochrome c-type biogenesis protein CcmH
MKAMKLPMQSMNKPSPRKGGFGNPLIRERQDSILGSANGASLHRYSRWRWNDTPYQRFFIPLLLLLLALVTAPIPAAVTLESFTFPTTAEEEHFKALIGQLRCLVCQNETLADSDADLAHDLRAEVYEMMKSGKSDKEVIDFLVKRYGDFVLYNPPVKPSTYLIWYGPFVLLAIAALLLMRAVGRQQQVQEPTISEQDRKRLERLLGNDAGKGKQG